MVNSYVKMPTFSRIVLSGNDVLVPDDLLGGVQRHLVELFYLGDSSLMAGHLNRRDKEFMGFVFVLASSSINHRIICPLDKACWVNLCDYGLPFKHSRWPNVGYIHHSTRRPITSHDCALRFFFMQFLSIQLTEMNNQM